MFFEAAARLKSYSRAARELKVSQVAVSKRIKALEAELGRPLFERQGRSIALTTEGEAFAQRVTAGLSFLEEAVSVARANTSRQRQVIQIAANENMNFFWLAPLVRRFQMAGNDAVVSVVTANNVTDVVRDDTDLAIFYGKAPPAGWSGRVLFDEVIAPVASPDYRARLGRGEVQEPTLLDYRKEAPDWVNWESFRGTAAERWFPKAVSRLCSSYIQSVGLAVDGMGVALGVLPMLSSELGDGKLVSLVAEPVRTGHKYFLSTPDGKKTVRATQELSSYFLAAAMKDTKS